jgi:hypothetical protein
MKNVSISKFVHAFSVVSRHVPLGKQHVPSIHGSPTQEVPTAIKVPPIFEHERIETSSQPTGSVQHAP